MGDSPIECEEEEHQIVDPNRLAKQVLSGSILDVKLFLEVTNNKEATEQIVQSLEDVGLLKLCTYPFTKLYDVSVADFYLNASCDNFKIKSVVGGLPVEITLEEIRSTFGLQESDLLVKEQRYNLHELWNIVRLDETHNILKLPQHKSHLKVEFERLLDIIHKCVLCQSGSVDKFSKEAARVMHCILNKVKVDWGMYIYEKIETFVEGSRTKVTKQLKNGMFLQRVGFGFLIGELLLKQRVKLKASKNVGNYKILFKSGPPSNKGKKRQSEINDHSEEDEQPVDSDSIMPHVAKGKRSKRQPRSQVGSLAPLQLSPRIVESNPIDHSSMINHNNKGKAIILESEEVISDSVLANIEKRQMKAALKRSTIENIGPHDGTSTHVEGEPEEGPFILATEGEENPLQQVEIFPYGMDILASVAVEEIEDGNATQQGRKKNGKEGQEEDEPAAKVNESQFTHCQNCCERSIEQQNEIKEIKEFQNLLMSEFVKMKAMVESNSSKLDFLIDEAKKGEKRNPSHFTGFGGVPSMFPTVSPSPNVSFSNTVSTFVPSSYVPARSTEKPKESMENKIIRWREQISLYTQKDIIDVLGEENRTLKECVEWHYYGVLPGDTIYEAYENYMAGRVNEDYIPNGYSGNFHELQKYINHNINIGKLVWEKRRK